MTPATVRHDKADTEANVGTPAKVNRQQQRGQQEQRQ
jgi:hypothetical protein